MINNKVIDKDSRLTCLAQEVKDKDSVVDKSRERQVVEPSDSQAQKRRAVCHNGVDRLSIGNILVNKQVLIQKIISQIISRNIK